MRTNILIIIPLCLFALASCQRQPDASFKTDKSQYVAGETVYLTNTSLDGHSYLWTMPDGQTTASRDVSYTLNPNLGNGTLTFKLEAFSKNGKKDDDAQRTVTVSAATGNAVFWQQINSGYGITVVTVDGISSNIVSEYPSAPSCGASGCAVFNGLEVGTYPFSASDGYYNWSGTVTITKDGCAQMLLY